MLLAPCLLRASSPMLLGQCSQGELGAVVTAGSPCRAWGASRAVKPPHDHAVSVSLPALLFPGATMKSPRPVQDWEMG